MDRRVHDAEAQCSGHVVKGEGDKQREGGVLTVYVHC
jgi:hypothetical protein